MQTWHLRRELWLPRPRTEVFPFFADAGNLDELTPPWLHFRILTPQPIVMRAGAKIAYQIRIHGVPVRWHTEITAWEPMNRFVDEQQGGPYRLWVHEHTFEDRDGGTLCRDHIEYAPVGGALVNRFFVTRDLERVFEYRSTRLRARFG